MGRKVQRTFEACSDVVFASSGCGTASIEAPTCRESSMYAPMECLLNCFVKRCSLSGCRIHAYPSSTRGCNRTWLGSTWIPNCVATGRLVRHQANLRRGAHLGDGLRSAGSDYAIRLAARFLVSGHGSLPLRLASCLVGLDNMTLRTE